MAGWVQSVTANEITGTGTYTSAAFGSSTVSGNLIVVSTSDDSGTAGGAITSVTDNKSNTFTKIVAQVGSSNTLTMYYCVLVGAGSGHTITVNYSTVSSTNNSMAAQEFSGPFTASPLDKQAVGSGTGTAVATAATAALSQTDEIVVVGMTDDTIQTPTLGSGYTNLSSTGVGTPATNVGQESKVVAATTAVTGTFTITSTNWGAIVATFKLASSTASGMIVGNFAPGRTWINRFAKAERHPYFISGARAAQTFTADLTAGLSFAGSVTKQTNKSPFTGGLSFTGAFSKLPVKALTGVLSFTGAISRRISKILTGGLSFSGAFTKLLTKVPFTGTLSFTGSFIKKTVKSAFSGVLSFTGAFVETAKHFQTYTATLSFIGASTRSPRKNLTGTLSFTGAIKRVTSKGLTGTLSFTGSFVKRLAKTAFTATLSFTGAFLKGISIKKAFTATLSFAGAFATFIQTISHFAPVSIILNAFRSDITLEADKNIETVSSSDRIETVNSDPNTNTINSDPRTETVQADSNQITVD